MRWGLFTKHIEVPSELKKINNEADELSKEQIQMLRKIAGFINCEKWSTGIVRFTVTPVTGTKRFKEMIRKFGNDNLDVQRTVQQISINQRRMETSYILRVLFEEHIFEVELVTYVTTSNRSKMSAKYDNQLQEMCNITALGYCKSYYPWIYKILIKCVEVPSLQTVEEELKKRVEKIVIQQKYRLDGMTLHPIQSVECKDSDTHPNMMMSEILVK